METLNKLRARIIVSICIMTNLKIVRENSLRTGLYGIGYQWLGIGIYCIHMSTEQHKWTRLIDTWIFRSEIVTWYKFTFVSSLIHNDDYRAYHWLKCFQMLILHMMLFSCWHTVFMIWLKFKSWILSIW